MSEPTWGDLSKKEKLALICETLPNDVRAAVEKHYRGKPMPSDPMAAINVVLRESWRAEHGEVATWDANAAAAGVTLR